MTMLLVGGLEAARYIYTVQALHSHADALLRAALVYVGTDTRTRCLADLSTAVPAPDLPVGLDAGSVTERRAGCLTGSNRNMLVSVSVTYSFSFTIRLFGAGASEISRTAQQSL